MTAGRVLGQRETGTGALRPQPRMVSRRVYPRPRGEAGGAVGKPTTVVGLSPPTRGSLQRRGSEYVTSGSIPCPGRGCRSLQPTTAQRMPGIADDNTGFVSTTSLVRPDRENPTWLAPSAIRPAASASRRATSVNGHRKWHTPGRRPRRERSDRSGGRPGVATLHDLSPFRASSASAALDAVGWMALDSSM